MGSDYRLQALESIARGADLSETLRTVVNMAAGPGFIPALAILILRNDGLVIGASQGLSPADRQCLEIVCDSPFDGFSSLECVLGAEIRPLLSGASEVLGAIVLFGQESSDRAGGSMDEVCSIAALAIEQKNLLDELTHRAEHDPLTQLWNRVRMEDEIALAFATAPGTASGFALLFLDFDRFRLINDVLGHQVGDRLLCEAAQRFRERIGPEVFLARGGGDEFLFFKKGVQSSREAALVGGELMACLQEPFQVADHELIVTASIGASTELIGLSSPAQLQASAYTALHYAKERGRNRIAEFDRSMVGTPPERLEMERHLRSALASDQLLVYFQPQIELCSGRLTGVEALARWKHPSIGFISPATFIPIAEEIGLIEELGAWMVREALRQIRNLRTTPGLEDLCLALNVSTMQFSRPDFSTWIIEQIGRSGTVPGAVEIEITESLMMRDFSQALGQMQALRECGVKLAIDDFGTGHSSLAYLQELPVERLKIDRIFVKNIVSPRERPPLLSNIISMARALEMTVIAEGIETEAQARVLEDLGCDHGQGFLFARPLSFEDFLDWTVRRQRVPAAQLMPMASIA